MHTRAGTSSNHGGPERLALHSSLKARPTFGRRTTLLRSPFSMDRAAVLGCARVAKAVVVHPFGRRAVFAVTARLETRLPRLEREGPEALEGLGLAGWWLDLADVAFDSRERAYRL